MSRVHPRPLDPRQVLLQLVGLLVGLSYGAPALAYRIEASTCSGLASVQRDECLAYAKNDESKCQSTQHVAVCLAILEQHGATRVVSSASTVCKAAVPPYGGAREGAHAHSGSYDYAWCLAMATGPTLMFLPAMMAAASKCKDSAEFQGAWEKIKDITGQ